GPAWQENSSYFASIDHSIYSAVTAGDVDADGLPDLIVGDLNGKLFFHRNTGFGFEWITTVLQNIQLSGWSSPRLVDIDADGDLDIVAGEENGKLNLIKNAGSPETAVWVHIPNFFGTFDIGSNCVPAPVDLDFDGDIDLLCGGSFGDLAYLQNTNGVYTQNNMVIIGLDGNQNAAPCFGDLDGDGDPDLVLGEYSGVFSYFRNDFLFVDVPDQNKALTLARAFPNPCSDQLKLSIQLSDTKNVELTVLSSDGKMIRQQTIYADQNELITVILETSGWNKGVYLIKLRTAENEETLKVIRW
ncbi:MAG TPA: FG-GAP-like repeat-containing protein, partial [Bacteroidales bacterium]|nr:FG-GAP-like repeat-containing protein [Bacteroidales bacterium]